MEKIWKIKPADLHLRKKISQGVGLSEAMAQILINRGVTNSSQARRFLDCDLSHLHDPFLLKGVSSAVDRIKKAIAKHEKIMVWGDYDIDGITSVALLTLVLKKLGARVTHYLPNRLEEGYGLNKKGAGVAKKQGVTLLITVDCGVSAIETIKHLKKLSIETIVCDHHRPKESGLPCAQTIIDPWQPGCKYPFKHLAGVGVAFKLAAALGGDQKVILDEHLDIITLGTVGDIVPLVGENRVLVKHGLVSLARTKKLGLRALMEVSGLADKEISARHIGYILGPRINASGRLGSPEDSLKLLLVQTELEAYALAQTLNRGNRLRQKIEAQTLQEAIEQVESKINFKEHQAIVLGAANWHQGVIGIVASRIVERYFRPTIMMSFKDGFGQGSGRSIGNFHLLQALTQCQDLLEEYGGHKKACGVKVKRTKLERFSRAFNRVAKEMLLPEDLIPGLDLDLEMPLSDLTEQFIKELQRLEPFGSDNPQPLICSSKLEVKSAAIKLARNHLKFWVSDGLLTCVAMGYNKAGVFPRFAAGQLVALAYSPSINNWQGNSSIQLKVEDLKIINA
ncbi:single-stranded-DNA-specific exonuclease RecJ [Candidatus Omnitrophota bacterium]